MLVLSGGEPTIRRDLLAVAERICRAGMSLGLVTNARMLAYGDLLERLLAHRLEYVYLTLCGPTAELHDRHTRAQAFDQTLKGVQQLSGKVSDLTVNVVVTAWNVDLLVDLADLVAGFAPARLKFSMIEPEGNALEDFEGLVPRVRRAAAAVRSAVEHVRNHHPDLRPAVDGFPLCVIEGLEEMESGLREDGFFAMSEAFEPDFFPIDDRHRTFGERCLSCSLRRRCRGLYTQYLIRRGEEELTPLSRPVPNSFNILPVAEPEPFSLRLCPILSGRVPPPDPIRGLLVGGPGRGRAQRHRIDTRDFSDETLRRSIRKLEQVYFDRADDLLLSDLSGQLERLGLAATCRRCPLLRNCGGFWRPDRRPAFLQVGAYLDDVLAGLTGGLLDVGCGLTPYTEALLPAVRAGKLNYLGIDPAGSEAPGPDGLKRVRTSLEEFSWPGEPFDTVMALRSLNHLSEPIESLRKMAALARRGGRLILAEDVVFGTVRQTEKCRTIESRTDLPFEHLANLELEEAATLARRLGLRVIEQRSPRETNSTLWILILQKPGISSSAHSADGSVLA